MAREKYPIPETPAYTEELFQMVNSDPANAEEVLNPQFLAVHSNIKAVKLMAEAAQHSAEQAEGNSVPVGRKVNGKPLSADVLLTAADVGARPDTWTPIAAEVGARPANWVPTAAEIGARPATWTPSAADVGAVPTGRTVNGKPLSSNITLAATDVGARPSTWVPTAAEIGAVPTARKVNNKPLTVDITLSAADVSAVPTTRTVNGRALSGNISLSAADVGALATSMRGATNGVAPLTSGKVPASYLPFGPNWTRIGSRTLTTGLSFPFIYEWGAFCNLDDYDLILIKLKASNYPYYTGGNNDYYVRIASGVYNSNYYGPCIDIGKQSDGYGTKQEFKLSVLWTQTATSLTNNIGNPHALYWTAFGSQSDRVTTDTPDVVLLHRSKESSTNSLTFHGTITQEVYGGKLSL